MTAALALLAFSLAVAPRPVVARHRLRTVLRAPRRRPTVPAAVHPAAAAVAGAAGLAMTSAVVSPGAEMLLPLVAGALAGGTAGRVVNAGLARRVRQRSALAQVEAVAAVAAEVRAGQRPDAALAATGLARVPAEIGAVWKLSERSGAPMAVVLDRVEDDLRSRLRQRQAVNAQLAGARSTALLLAGLPGVGIAMGAAMGAAPLTTLFGSGAGQVALLAGVALDCVGVLWSGRIVAAAEGVP